MTPSWFQSAPHIYRLWGYLTPWDGLWAESCSRLCFLLGSSQLTRGETCISLSLEVQLVCILPPPVRSEVKLFSCVMTLCNPMDCSLPGSSIHGIFQARVLEWVAISFSRGSSRPRDRTQVSHIEGRHFTHWANQESPRRSFNYHVSPLDFSQTSAPHLPIVKWQILCPTPCHLFLGNNFQRKGSH